MQPVSNWRAARWPAISHRSWGLSWERGRLNALSMGSEGAQGSQAGPGSLESWDHRRKPLMKLKDKEAQKMDWLCNVRWLVDYTEMSPRREALAEVHV